MKGSRLSPEGTEFKAGAPSPAVRFSMIAFLPLNTRSSSIAFPCVPFLCKIFNNESNGLEFNCCWCLISQQDFRIRPLTVPQFISLFSSEGDMDLWQRALPTIAWNHPVRDSIRGEDVTGTGIPALEWAAHDGPRLVRLSTGALGVAGSWRPFLFGHLSVGQMCCELADLLWGDAGLALGVPVDSTAPGKLLANFSAATVVEATRRACMLRGLDGVGSARADPDQTALIAAALLRDVGCEWDGGAAARLGAEIIAAVDRGDRPPGHSSSSSDGGGPLPPEPIAATWADLFSQQQQEAGGSAPQAGLPLWYAAFMASQSVALRAAAASGLLGFSSDFRTTRAGVWHSFHVAATAPRAAAGAACPPIVLVHGVFTHAPSMLPLALLLAARTGRAVFVPDMLDFDFGYSRTHARGAAAQALSDSDTAAAAAAPVSPLVWADHAAALAEFVESVATSPSRHSAPGVATAAATAATAAATAAATSIVTPAVTPVDLVGHSFGGWASHRVALARPDLVRRLVLLCPGGGGRYRLAPATAMVAGPAVTRRVLESHVPAPLAPLAAHVIDLITRSPFHAHLLGSLTYDYAAPPSGAPVDAPALIVWGTEDSLHRPWVGRGGSSEAPGSSDELLSLRPAEPALLRGFARARGVWLEGGSHAIIIDSLVALRRCIVPFLEQADAPAPGDAYPTSSSAQEKARARRREAVSVSVTVVRAVARVLEAASGAAGGDRRIIPMIAGMEPGADGNFSERPRAAQPSPRL